jgi:hypothetical protein
MYERSVTRGGEARLTARRKQSLDPDGPEKARSLTQREDYLGSNNASACGAKYRLERGRSQAKKIDRLIKFHQNILRKIGKLSERFTNEHMMCSMSVPPAVARRVIALPRPARYRRRY